MHRTKVDLEIKPIETKKDDIKQPRLAEAKEMWIAPLGSSVIICGKSGSGKSTLLVNLLTQERFYKGFFKKTFIFSPTANGDDIQKQLGIPKHRVFTDIDEAPELLEMILESQKKKLEDSTADKVDQYCIIFDDIIGETKFLNDRSFTKCFYQVRHVNCTTFICTQHFYKVPKVCRLQANFIHFFQGSQKEVDTIVEDYAPPLYSSREFAEIVHDATKLPYSFLTVNMKKGWDVRFRKNLDEIIHLEKLSAINSKDTSFSTDGYEEKQNNDPDEPGDRAGKGPDRRQPGFRTTNPDRNFQERNGPRRQHLRGERRTRCTPSSCSRMGPTGSPIC